MLRADFLQLCPHLGLIPLKQRSKELLVKWCKGWNLTHEERKARAFKPSINWGVRCGEKFAVVDCDSDEGYRRFIAIHALPPDYPVVKTARGYRIWPKPGKHTRSQRRGNVETKCLRSYMVALPSIHPSGVPYLFGVPVMRPFSSRIYLCGLGLSCEKYITSFGVMR